MAKVWRMEKGVEEGMKELLRFLLRSHKVKGVVSLLKLPDGAVAYSLITDQATVQDAMPLYPWMPANAGAILSQITLMGSPSEPLAAVVRPCELRAFVELVKRKQGSRDNLLFISSTCSGVYPLKLAAQGEVDEAGYWKAVREGEIPAGIRPTCRSCNQFLPYNADITVNLAGNKEIDKRCDLILNTEKAEEVLSGLEGKIWEEETTGEEVKLLLQRRGEAKKELYEELKPEELGLSGLVDIFGRCLNCHACGNACPICYCELCDFDSRDYEYGPSTYLGQLAGRGGVKIPPNSLTYQLGRLTHIGISCVGCGMCTDVCPADIPVGSIFYRVGEQVQAKFDYVPGKDWEEEVPLTVFKEKEFTEVGE